MTLGVPGAFSFQSSNVSDEALTMIELIENCEPPVIDPGLQIQHDDWVYEYDEDVSFTPAEFTTTAADSGVYQLEDILLKDCKLVKVVGKSGTGVTTHQRPKEPEEYSGFDYTMRAEEWSHRYIKVSSKTECGWLEKTWENNVSFRYYMQWCPEINSHYWTIRDLRVANNCELYRKKIIQSPKYDAGTDIMAQVITWGRSGLTPLPGVLIKSLVERGGYYYMRTNLNLPLEYDTWETGSAFQYVYADVVSPADIKGFIQKRRINCLNPFDGKNYTKAVYNTNEHNQEATWTLLTSEDLDSIAFGRVVCDTINVRITDDQGELLFEFNNYEIDNTIAPNRNEEYPTTAIIYTSTTIPAGSVILVTLKGGIVSVGEITPASKLEAGFTRFAFKNKFKDFSPKEQDQWGNWYYIDGVRVQVHSGVVELPITSYDQMNRLMMMIGGQKVVINSSDSIHNEMPDSRDVFSATMMIGRFTTFELATSEKNKQIGELATYNFTVEELV